VVPPAFSLAAGSPQLNVLNRLNVSTRVNGGTRVNSDSVT
jgi:hypothetical protein